MMHYLRLASQPLDTLYRATAKWKPEVLWSRWDRLSGARGFDSLSFVLSFDCDTAEDAAVVLDLDQRLRDLGVNASYAVPGELLKKEEKIYRSLFERGAEFLNHGYTEHTFWNKERSRYESCFFYDQLSREKVAQDIRAGHENLKKVFGAAPRGFRAPHFGTFQKVEQLQFLYDVLRKLGYLYSSSTTPIFGFRNGCAYPCNGLTELPVTGTFSQPMQIHDSWCFFEAPDRKWSPADYVQESEAFAMFAKENSMAGVLNFYADPSHVAARPEFLEAVKVWMSVAKPATFPEVLARVRA